MASLLPALRELVPSDSAGFFWVDSRGEMRNLYAERLLPADVMSLYFERYYEGREASFRKAFLERAAAPDGVAAHLLVHASLATIVFAAQGQPPFRLLAGSRDAPAGALPVSAVVPQIESERPRFGRATLGAFTADEAAERTVAETARQARLRPWLLWTVLIAGVAGLGALVWRLARSGPEPSPPS